MYKYIKAEVNEWYVKNKVLELDNNKVRYILAIDNEATVNDYNTPGILNVIINDYSMLDNVNDKPVAIIREYAINHAMNTKGEIDLLSCIAFGKLTFETIDNYECLIVTLDKHEELDFNTIKLAPINTSNILGVYRLDRKEPIDTLHVNMNKPLVVNCKNNFRVVAIGKLPLDNNNDDPSPDIDISMDDVALVLNNMDYTITKIGNLS